MLHIYENCFNINGSTKNFLIIPVICMFGSVTKALRCLLSFVCGVELACVDGTSEDTDNRISNAVVRKLLNY